MTRAARRSSRPRSMAEEYVPAAPVGKPHHHEHPLGIGDTFFAFGEVHRVVGMVGLGMPLREITLQVEPVRGVEGGGGGGG